jgi:hypothetical protein
MLEILPPIITNILRAVPLPQQDMANWCGVFRLSSAEYRILLDFLKSATPKEIKDFNDLLKKKIWALKK